MRLCFFVLLCSSVLEFSSNTMVSEVTTIEGKSIVYDAAVVIGPSCDVVAFVVLFYISVLVLGIAQCASCKKKCSCGCCKKCCCCCRDKKKENGKNAVEDVEHNDPKTEDLFGPATATHMGGTEADATGVQTNELFGAGTQTSGPEATEQGIATKDIFNDIDSKTEDATPSEVADRTQTQTQGSMIENQTQTQNQTFNQDQALLNQILNQTQA